MDPEEHSDLPLLNDFPMAYSLIVVLISYIESVRCIFNYLQYSRGFFIIVL